MACRNYAFFFILSFQGTFGRYWFQGGILLFSFPIEGKTAVFCVSMYFLFSFCSSYFPTQGYAFALNCSSMGTSQRMMTEKPEKYQHMLQKLVFKAQQVSDSSIFSISQFITIKKNLHLRMYSAWIWKVSLVSNSL